MGAAKPACNCRRGLIRRCKCVVLQELLYTSGTAISLEESDIAEYLKGAAMVLAHLSHYTR